MCSYTFSPIGTIHTIFPEKFGIPRQSGLSQAVSAITFHDGCQNPDCFRGIEEYSHLWLIWGFSEHKDAPWSPLVRPPRLGGNEKRGVFATRSPFRPNPIGLSSVELVNISFDDPAHPVLYVRGADLLDGTPIFDIKPYIPYTDSHPDAAQSFAGPGLDHLLEVRCSPKLLQSLREDLREELIRTLSLDPRPSYQDDTDRIYGMCFSDYNVKFRVENHTVQVLSITGPASL